jgi:hypothetical protein
MEAFLGLCLGMVSTTLGAFVTFSNKVLSFFTEVESTCADAKYPQKIKATVKRKRIRKIIC